MELNEIYIGVQVLIFLGLVLSSITNLVLAKKLVKFGKRIRRLEAKLPEEGV